MFVNLHLLRKVFGLAHGMLLLRSVEINSLSRIKHKALLAWPVTDIYLICCPLLMNNIFIIYNSVSLTLV